MASSKAWRLILWGRAARMCWFSRPWVSARLNELATRQLYSQLHRRLLKMKCWYCLVVSSKHCTLGIRRLKPPPVGDARCYIADFRLDFREWAVPAGQFIITAPTRQSFQRRAWRCCKTLIAELVTYFVYLHAPTS